MEFSYYFNQTPISEENLLDFWPYDSSTTSGDFSVNETSNDYLVQIPNSAALDDFSVILTFKKKSSDARMLLSNYIESGWTVGITSGNFLYVDSLGSGENFVFKDINLSEKNCICIRKSGQAFSVYKFDLISNVLESSQTIYFSPTTILENDESINVGGNYDYVNSFSTNLVTFFDGYIEQLVFLDIALELSYILDLVNGFQPETLVENTVADFELLNSSVRYADIPDNFSYNFLSDYFSSTNQSLMNSSLPSGQWLGSSTGLFTPSLMTGAAVISTGITYCYGTGSYLSFFYSGLGSVDSAYFSDSIRYIKESGIHSISHNLTFSGIDFDESFHIDADYYYDYQEVTSSYTTSDPTYYTGFKMNGVVTDAAKFILLGTDESSLPYTYNQEAVFDNLNGFFYLNAFTDGKVYYDGVRVPTTGYSLADGYVDILNVIETSNDYIIYDNSTGLSLMYAGVKGCATGDFYSNASIVFTGQNSYTSVNRVSRSLYKETCRQHLYHNSEVQDLGSELFFIL